EAAKVAIERGDYPTLGELMNINHGLLSAIGVSNAKLEELVYAARQAGALGAKITGAGGGGMILALAWSEDAGKVAQALSRLSERVIVATISQEGARLEA
ncbi:MAG: mevalonate kinase, partial [Thermofilaceae archaeon]